MHSLASHHRSFYILLGSILFVHAALMVTKIKDHLSETNWSAPQSIKLKLVQEHIQKLSASQKKQIVQSEDSSHTDTKKEAYLSDKTRSFERETVAKNVATFNRAAQGDANHSNEALTKKSKSKKKVDVKDLKLADVGIEMGEVVKEISRSPASQATKGLKNGDPLAMGLSATNDYVEEITLGDFTHLNTVEYKFYGFYHRIRQKLEQFWGKSIHEKAQAIFRQGRRLPASENLITSLQVTLNERGEIVGVKVLGASGVRELDEAAVESFNQAGPFPNPPKELLVNGQVTIDWGFVVKA